MARAAILVLVLGGSALALCGCGAAEAMTAPSPTPKPQAAPSVAAELGLSPGETMTYEVHLGGLLAGEAQLAVGQLGELDGHRAIVVKSRAATAGAVAMVEKIVDEATTTIDADTGRPVLLDTLVEQGGKSVTAHVDFVGSIANVSYRKGDDPAEKPPHTYKVDFGSVTVHDTHSAMAQVRGWRPAAGAQRTVYVLSGRRLWRVDLKYVGAETIGTQLGNRRTVRLDGAAFRARANFGLESQTPARTFSVWLSDDADRVPLLVSAHTELGDVKMELTEYVRP